MNEEAEDEQKFNKIYSEEFDQFKQNIEIVSDQEEGIDQPNQEEKNAESLEPSYPATTSLTESSTVTLASAKLSETIAAASILTASALLSATTTALLSSSATLSTTTFAITETAIPAATKNQIDKPNTHPNGGQPGASVHLNESTSLSMASTVIIWLLKLVFGHVPYFIFRILSTTLSFTVTLDFWTGLYLFCFTVLIGVIVYRYGGLSCLLDHL